MFIDSIRRAAPALVAALVVLPSALVRASDGATDTAGQYPHTVMPVYLQSIPEGSKCKVFLMRGNTQLKGSVSSYTVDAAAP